MNLLLQVTVSLVDQNRREKLTDLNRDIGCYIEVLWLWFALLFCGIVNVVKYNQFANNLRR